MSENELTKQEREDGKMYLRCPHDQAGIDFEQGPDGFWSWFCTQYPEQHRGKVAPRDKR